MEVINERRSILSAMLVGRNGRLPEEVAHASLLVYTAMSCNCIPVIQTVLE